MTNKITFFNDALRKVSAIIAHAEFPIDLSSVVIRDIHGRIRIAIDGTREINKALADRLVIGLKDLGAFTCDGEKGLLFREDIFDPDSLFKSTDILDLYLIGQDMPLRLLDRQITGQDWLRPSKHLEGTPPRLVFYGLKGGVGRSTALTMLAYELARSGKRVLLIDFDLESPGLSSLLLPPDRLADFGLVDWFIEDGVGQGDAVLRGMISVSPLSEYTQGEIRVAAAMGMDEPFYLAKLSRVYADVARDGVVERFSQRVSRFVDELEAQEKPDVVLIDSRAGLHDLAAVSIVSLATKAFLFANDTAQSWQGYRLLFSYWQAHPKVLRAVRDKLLMVEALFPESDQAARANSFLENAYTLFSETIYEIIEPGVEPDPDVYNFDMNDDAAPHYPLRIKWNNRFQEFNPLLMDKNNLTEADITATFGDFIGGVKKLIKEGQA